MQPIKTLTWNVTALLEALGLTAGQTIDFCRDGRKMNHVILNRLANELNMEVRSIDGGGEKLVRGEENWLVRCISDKINFCPSFMLGKGRHFDSEEFAKTLESWTGYFIADLPGFPTVDVWQIPSSIIIGWNNSRQLAKGAMNRKELLYVLKHL